MTHPDPFTSNTAMDKIMDDIIKSVAVAEPGDIYEDQHGCRWRVVGIFHKPSVIMELEIQGGQRITGAMTAPMWDGFKLVERSKS